MIRRGAIAVVVGLALWAGAVAVSATPATVTISGRITGTHGRPLAGVNVEVQDLDVTRSEEEVYTDRRGHWSVQAAPGRYIVEFSDCNAGYASQYYGGAIEPELAKRLRVRSGTSVSSIGARLLVGGEITRASFVTFRQIRISPA